ncbi:MAG TPA: response regulator transcription factor [Ktedonobacteraceae bacterium]|jgi:DNA-binding NarL/FixJ family response regulator
MRVLIVAPTPMMQAGLQTLLSAPDIHLVGTAMGAADLPESAHNADVLVLADDTHVAELVRALLPTRNAALVLLTDKPESNIPLLSGSGLPAWGIVPPDTTPAQLQSAVHATAQGLVVLPAGNANQLSNRSIFLEPEPLSTTDEALTPREREVLELVGQGLPNKLIARKLQISEHTVKFHLSSVSTKLGAVSRTDAVRLGLRQGLITV